MSVPYEQNQLFAHRNNVSTTDIVIYFVRTATTNGSLNGCAAHPSDSLE